MLNELIISIGESDCEAIGDGLLAQPVNALSSLVFAVFGIILLASRSRNPDSDRTNRLVLGFLMISTGIGSLLFHGPQGSASHFLHDVTIIATVLAIATTNLAGLRTWTSTTKWVVLGVGVLAGAIAITVWPSATNVLAGISVVGLIVVDVLAHRAGAVRGRWWIAATLALVVAVVFFIVGRTGGPLCDSASLFQGHAMWHMLAASALWAYFESTTSARTGQDR